MFIDTAAIFCKPGDGGNGCVSFHREKYVMNGGPDGGDGGRGGDICFQADESVNTLLSFRYNRHFKAGNGEKGQGNNMTGKSGADLIIKVPRGTVIKDADSGGIIADVYNYDEKVIILKGGRGGRGNARFCTPTRQAPAFAENGDSTKQRKLLLELKTIADIGLIGYPNVGKSTLLSVISAARPKIANYPFTTLSPNLGAVSYHEDSFIAADIPGLIEGAAEGVGLGHSFLRHIERVRLIVHLVDISASEGREPATDYLTIRSELKKYSAALAELPELVVANKCDLHYAEDSLAALERAAGTKPIMISAATTYGVKELVGVMASELKKLPKPQPLSFIPFEYEKDDKESYYITKSDGVYYVTGGFVEELAKKVYLDDTESFAYFQRKMRERGILTDLRAQGAVEGDTVCVLDLEFTLID